MAHRDLNPPRAHTPHEEPKPAARWDDRILAVLMLGLAGPRIVLALIDHEVFGAEATIATIVAGLGLLLLLASARTRR